MVLVVLKFNGTIVVLVSLLLVRSGASSAKWC